MKLLKPYDDREVEVPDNLVDYYVARGFRRLTYTIESAYQEESHNELRPVDIVPDEDVHPWFEIPRSPKVRRRKKKEE